MSTHLPPLQPRRSIVAANAPVKPGALASVVAASGGGAAAAAAAGAKKGGIFNVALIAQMALDKKREKLKYVAKLNKDNLLKDKALYRAERDINLNHFRELMNVFQLDGREVMKHLGSNKNNPLIDRETPWIHDIRYMKPLQKFAIASDDHEITLYNMATMQGKIRFDLKDSVALSLDFWFDEENPDAETCTLFFGTDLGHIYSVNIVNSAFVNKNENVKNKCVTMMMDMFGRGSTKGMGTLVKRKAHDNWVGKVKYYHDWHAVVSCSIDPLASLVVAIQDGKNSWSYFSAPVNHGVNTFVYSRFPVALITGGTDHQLRVWNPHRLKNPMASFKGHSSPIIDLVVNEQNGQVISLAVDNVIKDALSGVHIFKFSETHGKSELTAVTFDVGHRKLITGARDGTIYIWNFHNGQKIKELVKNDNCEVTEIIQIEMHATKYIVAVGWNRKVTIFLDDTDSDKEYPYSTFPSGNEFPPWHNDDIMCVSFTQPNILATASFDGGIVLSNVQSGHLLKRLKWPNHEVANINKSIEKERLSNTQGADLITAGGDGVIRWWRTSEAELMWEMNGVKGRAGESIYAVITNPTNSILITGDTLGWVMIYNIKETCIDGRENITVPPVLCQFRAHTRCIVSIDIFDTHIVTASTDGTSRLFTSHGKYIGTFGQEQVWDIAEPANPPIPPDVLLVSEKDVRSPSLAQARFRRASVRLMQELKDSKSDLGALSPYGDTQSPEPANEDIAPSTTGASRAVSAYEELEEPDISGSYLSLSNFSDVVSAATSAASSARSSIVPLQVVEKNLIAAAEAGKRTSLQILAARKQSLVRTSMDDTTMASTSWKSRNIRTPDLLQTNYRTWYGKSQYAKEYLQREKLKGKRTPASPQDIDDAGKLPNIAALDSKISIAYHSLHPSKIDDFADNLHMVAGLPVVAGIIAKSKTERSVALAAPVKEESSTAIRNRSVGPNELFSNKSIMAPEVEAGTNNHGKPSTKPPKSLRRLGTPAIRELIESDADNKRQAIQDYIFGSLHKARSKVRAKLLSNQALTGAVVIVTGASRGIGEQLAYQLAAQQATLVLPVRDLIKAEAIVNRCKELGARKVHTIKYDASDRESCISLVEETVNLEGRLDAIILNHATSCFEPLFQMSKEDQTKIIRNTMESNYFGYVNIAMAALPHLQKTAHDSSKCTSIVIVGSLAGRVGTPFVHAYSASKHAIDGFFNCLRHELALVPNNKVVLTNCVLGAIGTQNFYDTVSGHAKSILQIAVSPAETATRIVEAFVGQEEQFYFPSIIQAQYLINAVSHQLSFKVGRMAYGL
ncbi:UNVERIFIED_CONTAM: WD40 repeat domain 95 [Siphonaria sp. JEL0065]|nr:WD40 repeat domain 95 [Siphonaria sp. JEL0065]